MFFFFFFEKQGREDEAWVRDASPQGPSVRGRKGGLKSGGSALRAAASFAIDCSCYVLLHSNPARNHSTCRGPFERVCRGVMM